MTLRRVLPVVVLLLLAPVAAESVTLKVTPSSAPKNVLLQ